MQRCILWPAVFVAVLALVFYAAPVLAAPGNEGPAIEWERHLGGGGYDVGTDFQQTSDGGTSCWDPHVPARART